MESGAGVAGEQDIAGHSLFARLDSPLPARIATGRGTALFVHGWCVAPQGRITALGFELNGSRQPVQSVGAPRLDVFRALHPGRDVFALSGGELDPSSREDPGLQGYRCGFWGLLRLPAGSQPGELRLCAELDGGPAEASTALAQLQIKELPPRPRTAGARLVICMATYNPPLELFKRQIDSIRKQSIRDWICVISDDCSAPELYTAIEHEIGGDERFVLSRSPARLGFYGNFERALALVPIGSEFIAMADQDDAWYPDKLERLLEGIGEQALIYSDTRIVSESGELISETYWSRRQNNHSDLLSVLVANSVTGAASLFRSELLDYALPFPPAQFAHFHDHWIALVALALGGIEFCPEPLYDYVQHGEASLGHAAANRMDSLTQRLAGLRGRALRERVGAWRMHYFVDIARLSQFAAILELRCDPLLSGPQRRVVRQFQRADQSAALLTRLAVRGAGELLGRRSETLGAEWMLSQALLWRRLLSATTRDRPVRGLRLDAVPPPTLVQQPGRRNIEDSGVREIAEKVAPLEFSLSDGAPTRVNLLIPTIDLAHFFGGYIAKLNLARKLSEQGLRVRIITVDPVGALAPSWQATLESYSGLAGVFEQVEVAFGRESPGLEISPSDHFIATTWWTAHIAREAVRMARGTDHRFLYLIQEYEPFTFPHGTYAALADESYTLPHRALFSSELLRGYFRDRGLGVYAAGTASGDANSRAFENAITAIEPPMAAALAARETRRLLFYARPEPHAARNMFELGVLALERAVRAGGFGPGWELHGIGSIATARSLSLGREARLELRPRAGQGDYGAALASHDVGLALMYTPHPSLVPIEMASAGMLTVTNSYENKTAEALTGISPNLICAPPTVDGVAAALLSACAGAEDFERRAAGARATTWSRRWDDSLHPALIDDVLQLLLAD